MTTNSSALLAAAFVALALGVTPAFAGEGRGDPFASASGGWTTAARLRSVAADVGAEQQYRTSGRPGTDLLLSAELLPVNGSEGVVQTANSVPPKFTDGTVQFAQARNTEVPQAARPDRTAFAAARRHDAGQQG